MEFESRGGRMGEPSWDSPAVPGALLAFPATIGAEGKVSKGRRGGHVNSVETQTARFGRNFGASMRSRGRARSPLRIHDPALLSVLPDSLAAP